MLPVAIDINPASVTKLVDRGSVQSIGIVTDVGLFLKELAARLAPDELDKVGPEPVEEIARRARAR
jgi:hypothetical protein